ncbi:hypothetical protein EDD18DRAFT_1356237 [Armillaria luteobubalina]|uniref:Uncharacterized protein n=1 Tax=Armillaria luteobubalina TaxID=153913 RepID=A0AA39UL31_9AGAR|nr:hypothetical protein EDD18DRAFT_1356237 [Armillaria luteobubalina]
MLFTDPLYCLSDTASVDLLNQITGTECADNELGDDIDVDDSVVQVQLAQELLDKILWEVVVDIIVAKTTSISSHRMTITSQKALYKHIHISRKRTPELWSDIFEVFPLFGTYVRSVSIENVTPTWEATLCNLLQLIDVGHPLSDLYITHTSFRPLLSLLLNRLWPKFKKIMLVKCTLSEECIVDMLDASCMLRSLCIGFADENLLSSTYGGHWMTEHTSIKRGITSF